MPCEDPRLAELPTKEDHLVTEFRGEIDEALVYIFEKTAEFFDSVADFGHARGHRPQFGMVFDYLRQAHRVNVIIDLNERLNTFAQCASLELKVTNQRFKSRDKLVGVVDAE